MGSRTQTISRLDEDFGWTGRQREVLSLLAKGYTNGQIGERLGISLAGAKWHVSEIISKLGVDTREEAAEYWRRYNGAPARLRRIWSGVLPSSLVLRVAGALGALAIAGAAVGLGVASSGGGGGSNSTVPAVAGKSTTPTAVGMAPTPAPTGVPGVFPALTTPIPLPSNADLSAPSGSVVWALVANQALFRSSDSGANWEERPLPPEQDGYFYGGEISFVDENDGWILGPASPATQCQAEGTEGWRTMDGGATWQELPTTQAAGPGSELSGISAGQCKGSLSFVDASHGFISAWDPNSRPVIYRTSDGGASWTASAPFPDPPGEQTSAGGFTLTPGQVAQRGDELLVDATGFQHMYVYTSRDGGATWSYAATVPNAVDVGNVTFRDATHWWAVSEGPGQQVTADAGKTWQAAPGNLQFAAPIAPVITFPDSEVGYATVRGEIERTTDGGQHWAKIETPGT